MKIDPAEPADLKSGLALIWSRVTENQTALSVSILGLVGIIVAAVVAFIPISTSADGELARCGSVMAPLPAALEGRGSCGSELSAYVARSACAFFGGVGFIALVVLRGLFARLLAFLGGASVAAVLLGVFEGSAKVFDIVFVAYAFAMIWVATRFWSGRASGDEFSRSPINKRRPGQGGSMDDSPADLSSILGKPKRK